MPSNYIHSIQQVCVDDDSNGLLVNFQGCPASCRVCNTPAMWKQRCGFYSWSSVRLQVAKHHPRHIILSGGEPLHNESIDSYVKDGASLGISMSMQTAGFYPDRLSRCIPNLSFLEFNVLGRFKDYVTLTGVYGAVEKVEASILNVINGMPNENYVFSLVYHPWLIKPRHIGEVIDMLASLGVKRFVLKAFAPHGCKDSILVGFNEKVIPNVTLLNILMKRERKYGIKILTKGM